MNPTNTEKPKYIYLTLMFDDDEKNQHSMINIEGAERVFIDNWPEFKQTLVQTVGSNNGTLDTNKVTRMVYCIVVDYGEEGIDVEKLNASNS